jgi:prepilin-type N-terminal cleavage/methylation domain-containing protein
MLRRAAHSRGFTLVEALVCVALISGGIAICMTTLSAISRAEIRVSDRETMQRLAVRKYDELIILGTLTSGELSGDFAEIGESRFQWRADRSQSSVGNLDVIRVDVAPKGDSYAHATEVQGLLSTAKASGS